MFEIVNSDGEVIALADEPRYVCRSPKNGVWIRCDEPDAECVAVNGTRYSIRGRAKVDDAPPVSIRKADAAAKILALTKEQIARASDIDEIKDAYADLADAVLDLYFNN